MSIHNYEMFKIQLYESISEIYNWFWDIISALKVLGKIYPNGELVKKILRCLPRDWDSKVTTIQEPKDLGSLKLQVLVGSLETHKLLMKGYEEDERKMSFSRSILLAWMKKLKKKKMKKWPPS